MKIAINGYHLKSTPKGIGNFIINALTEMSKHSEYKLILYCNPFITDNVLAMLPSNVKIVKLQRKNDLLWLLFTLPKLVNEERPDIFWSPSPIEPFGISKKIKKMVTVHDFVCIDCKNTMTLKGRLIMKFLMPKSIKRADYIWSVSDFTKKRINEVFPRRRQVNVIVGEGPSNFFSSVQTSISTTNGDYLLKKFNIKKTFLMFTGTLEPRKNIKYMLRLFQEVRRIMDIQLVITGAKGWGNIGISKILESDGYPKGDVLFLGFVSNEDLNVLYKNSACYLSTALYEGLGLSQLEAMSCSCPVISPDNSGMAEVVKGAGVVVEGWEYRDWISAIDFSIKNRDMIIKRQNERLENYKWDEIINKVTLYLKNSSIE